MPLARLFFVLHKADASIFFFALSPDSQIQFHIKLKHKKPSLSIVNAGPPDIMYLYYPLNVEGVTLMGSLLPEKQEYT